MKSKDQSPPIEMVAPNKSAPTALSEQPSSPPATFTTTTESAASSSTPSDDDTHKGIPPILYYNKGYNQLGKEPKSDASA